MSEVIVSYSKDIEDAIRIISKVLEKDREISSKYNLRWFSIKLIEGDEEVLSKAKASAMSGNILAVVNEIRSKLSKKYGDPEVLLAEERYRIISSITRRVLRGMKTLTVSDLLDKAFLDKYLGLPIFLVILWAMFQWTMLVSAPFCDFLGDFFSWISGGLSGLTGNIIIDYLFFGDYGVVNGLGFILGFVPIIFFLYFALSIIEDSGYMARAAFVMDKLMRKFALTGRTIFSMILGFGCNVPAIYSTRAIPGEVDRLTAIVINPLMLCSARLTAFSLLAYAFFGKLAGDVIFSLYLLGIVLAILMALILRKIYFKGKISPFVLELPEYEMPTLRTVSIHMWEKGSMFFKKAGTVILAGLIVIGILVNVESGSLAWTGNVENSLVAALGRAFQPFFSPLGWDWRLVVAAIFGFVAKEIVLGATAMLYGVPEEGLASALRGLYTPLVAYAYMVFILVYVPCIVTIAAIKHEAGWKWAFFTTAYELILAYVMALLIYFFGLLLGFG